MTCSWFTHTKSSGIHVSFIQNGRLPSSSQEKIMEQRSHMFVRYISPCMKLSMLSGTSRSTASFSPFALTTSSAPSERKGTSAWVDTSSEARPGSAVARCSARSAASVLRASSSTAGSSNHVIASAWCVRQVLRCCAPKFGV
eukprot:CAMPEP_0171093908 /NCGR_PEP_ID=MMETSP0766_2-20121228/39348_1 /TAXON_ID=439317 /ORGANISM="Gambierdiscus australes, Strain CAWD 149" /LENGTH=141 /DNA_ID=CAMNT_0011552415 /DNA_START=169 /DNA_END=594 /DNA_ORIENTATION=+